MTPQEAINRIDGLIANEKLFIKISTMGEIDHSNNIEALETAKQALEKQIPNKPLETVHTYKGCPKCKRAIYDEQLFCDRCGQALDQPNNYVV